MGMNVGADSGDEDEVIAAINTTPLVDIMLVLLIIFLITVPVARQSVQVELPKETNIPLETKPENILISVDREGDIYWNQARVTDTDDLFNRIKVEAVKVPQPEVHIRADELARYESVGKVVYTMQRASILKIGFILEPPPRN